MVPVIIRLESDRNYRIGPSAARWCALPLISASDITFDGNGSTLVFHPKNRAFLLLDCNCITIRNLKIDYDPLPFTQGDIIAINRNSGTFDVHLHDGFPDPPDHDWAVKNHGEQMAWRHGVFLEADRHRFTHYWIYVQRVEPVAGSDRTYRITPQPEHRGVLDHVEVGQRFVFRNRTADAQWKQSVTLIGRSADDRGVYYSNPAANIQIRNSTNCTLENIDQYISPGMSIRLTGADNTHIIGYHITYKPDSGRLIASLSDGIHAKNCRTGPFIEDCVFEGLMDDSINISTMSDTIIEKIDDRTFITRYSDIAYYDTPIRQGDRVRLWDPVEGRILGQSAVESVEFLSSHKRKITLAQDWPEVHDAAQFNGDTDRATNLYIIKEAPAEIRHCEFRSQLKTAALVRDAAIIENCRFEDVAFGIMAYNGRRFGEGPLVSLHVFRNNTFNRLWLPAITLDVQSERGKQIEPIGESILIENNIINDCRGGISLTNIKNATLRNNRIELSPQTPDGCRAISIVNCRDIASENNSINNPGNKQ